MTATAIAGTMCGIGVNTAYAASPAGAGQARVGANEICTLMGIGTGAAGFRKALARGAGYAGIGASVGCYLYSWAKEATPAQRRDAMIASYKKYQAMSDIKKLDALGYYCRKQDTGGGGGGTDVAPLNTRIGSTTIRMKGVAYTCTATRD
ncbi:hypothetical protein [Streptomyces sp. NPDC059010]|uniref:hypothetical protein n=1 Tax=Streptomyces sp. NPDC059010 TaxID=3346695 RepID=UPI0036C9D1C6